MNPRASLRTTIIVAMLGMLGPFAIDTIFPAFARIGVQFAATDAALQQIVSVYLLSFAVASLFHGPISDAVGRKPVMIVGLSVFVLASIGCALAPNLPVLLALRVLQGASAGAGQIIARALVRDLYEGVRAQRVMAQVAMIFGIAPAIAPVVGGALLKAGNWHVIFAFLAAYAGLLVAVVAFGLPETHPPASRTPVRVSAILGGLVEVGRSGRFVRLAVASAFGFAAQFLYIAGAPVVVVRLLGLGEQDFWVLFVPMIAGMVLGSWANSRLAARGRPVRLASVGFGLMLVSAVVNVLVAAAMGPVLPWAVIGPPITAFGVALAFPVVQLQMLDMFPARRGAAASLQSFVALLLNAAVAGIVVPMTAGSVLSMALTSAGFAVMAVTLWGWPTRVPSPVIEVAAVCLFDDDGRVLTVRKRGTTKWMLVGGKPEPEEAYLACAVREVAEELGVTLDASRLRPLDTFESTAANEGVPLLAHVFITDERVNPQVCAEIEELRWVDPANPGDDQAPLNTDLVFPLIRSRG